MQSSNPAMAVMARAAGELNFGGIEAGATMSCTTTKSLLLVAVTLVVGCLSMNYSASALINGQFSNTYIYLPLIGALIVAVVTCFKPELSPYTAPAYAVLEGAALGVLSMVFELSYPGIVATAVMSTFVVVLVMLALWKFRIVVPTARFRSIIVGATMGVAVLYLLNMLMHLFGITLLPTTGPISIIVSLLVCTIAAFNLILDFDNIETSVNQGLPKYFEYFNAFSLLVTICWLYIEILRLLANRGE